MVIILRSWWLGPRRRGVSSGGSGVVVIPRLAKAPVRIPPAHSPSAVPREATAAEEEEEEAVPSPRVTVETLTRPALGPHRPGRRRVDQQECWFWLDPTFLEPKLTPH